MEERSFKVETFKVLHTVNVRNVERCLALEFIDLNVGWLGHDSSDEHISIVCDLVFMHSC